MLQICVISLEHLILSPFTTSITADDFATFFTNKTKTISSQFSPPLTQDPQPSRSTAQTPIFSFCPPTEAEVSKLLLSSYPTTCPLDPIPSHLLQAISPTLLPALTHIINTSLLTGIFPTAFKQARVTPLLKKPTLNTSLLENYRPVSLLPFIAKTLKRVVFNSFPRDRFLDPSSSPHTLHRWLPSYRHMASPTISMLTTHSSISHFDQMIQR